jgi:hypothetical protein
LAPSRLVVMIAPVLTVAVDFRTCNINIVSVALLRGKRLMIYLVIMFIVDIAILASIVIFVVDHEMAVGHAPEDAFYKYRKYRNRTK